MTALGAALAAFAMLVFWPPSLAHRLCAAAQRPPVIRVTHVLSGVVLVQLGALLVGAPLVVAGAVVIAGAIAALLRRRAEARSRRQRQDATVEVVFAIAAELRSGRTPAEALTSAAEACEGLRGPLLGAAAMVRAGSTAVESLRDVASLPGCEVLAAVGAVWQVSEQAGGAVADVLDRLGATLEADIADRRSFEAALAGPRASMSLLAGLPLLGLLMGQSAGAHPVRLLLHRPLGWALLGGALALELAGLAWSRRLVRGVVPA